MTHEHDPLPILARIDRDLADLDAANLPRIPVYIGHATDIDITPAPQPTPPDPTPRPGWLDRARHRLLGGRP